MKDPSMNFMLDGSNDACSRKVVYRCYCCPFVGSNPKTTILVV